MGIEKEREVFEAVPEIKQWINALKYGEKTGVYIAIDNDKHEGVASWVNGAWWVWQAKAQAVPEAISIGNELQSWVAVNSFSADDGEGVLPVVDANAIAEKIEELTGANQ